MTKVLPDNARVGLERLGFDPLTKMVEVYYGLEEDVASLKAQPRYSHVAVAQLRSNQQQLLKTLMEYGYTKRRPEDGGEEFDKSLRIVLEYDTKSSD
jgi:hypothetical protein